METTTIFKSEALPKITSEEKVKAVEEVNQLIKKSHQTLLKIKTMFPFTLFPDRVLIDQYKVDIIYGIFFFSEQVFTVPIKNVNGASVSTDLFFGRLLIEINGYNENPTAVKFLRKQDAIRARRIITGLVACDKEGIDLSPLSYEQVVHKVEEIGRARSG